jgi:hypothetical protein
MVLINPFVPEPTGLQDVPFHTAMLLAAVPPACVNVPAAYRFPAPSNARVATDMEPELLVMPDPSGFHDVPSHIAIRFAATLPIFVKFPAA